MQNSSVTVVRWYCGKTNLQHDQTLTINRASESQSGWPLVLASPSTCSNPAWPETGAGERRGHNYSVHRYVALHIRVPSPAAPQSVHASACGLAPCPSHISCYLRHPRVPAIFGKALVGYIRRTRAVRRPAASSLTRLRTHAVQCEAGTGRAADKSNAAPRAGSGCGEHRRPLAPAARRPVSRPPPRL